MLATATVLGLDGVPNQKDTLRIAEQLGCRMRWRRRTGEIYIYLPNEIKPICINGRRKDSSKFLLQKLRKLAGMQDADLEPEQPAEDAPMELGHPTDDIDIPQPPASEPITVSAPPVVILESPPDPIQPPAMPPRTYARPEQQGCGRPVPLRKHIQYLSREDVQAVVNADLIYDPNRSVQSTTTPENRMPSFPEMLSNKLKEEGLSLAAAAKLSGINSNTIWQVSRKGGKPAAKNLERFANWFGISIEDIEKMYPADAGMGKGRGKNKLGKAKLSAASTSSDPLARIVGACADIEAKLKLAAELMDDDLATQIHQLDEGKRKMIRAIVSTF